MDVDAWNRVRAERAVSSQIVLARLHDVGLDIAGVERLSDVRPSLSPTATQVVLELMHDQTIERFTRQFLARGLEAATKTVSWDELVELYLRTSDPDLEEGLAAAIDKRAGKKNYTALVELVTDRAAAKTASQFFLAKIRRFGGEDGRKLLESLVFDQHFGWTAYHMLTGRESWPPPADWSYPKSRRPKG
ncbi:hypothetical protein [Gryllotalpicola koreensis]|uniref:Uncharacterized protein n=1 Tax=Gryllotalpicola koreensis TaxID=993086 RepID=A0ABP8A6D9_9MICO